VGWRTMSLINDVLRDLDRRQAPNASATSGASGMTALPLPKKKAWWPWLAGAVLLGAVGQLVYMAWPLPIPESVPIAPQVALVDSEPMLLAGVAETDVEAQANLDEPPAAESAQQPEPPAVASAPTDTVQPIQQASPVTTEPAEPVEIQAAPEANPVAQTLQPTAAETETPARIEIQRSASRNAEDPVDQALRAAARGQLGLAQSQLDTHLREVPGDSRARLLLAEVLVSQQRLMNARSVLEAGLNPDSAAELAPALARLLQGMDPAAAREVLLRYPPPPANAPDYHLLLSALHRQLGDHVQASVLYQRLTEIEPSNFTAWVGLGSSLESLGQPTDARAAYEIAAQSSDPRLSGFARQRLSALPATGEQP